MARTLKAELLQSSFLVAWTFTWKNPIFRNDFVRIHVFILTIATYCNLL